MHRRLLFLLCSLLLTTAAVAQYGASPQSGVKLMGRSYAELYAAQKVILSSYCRLDFEGARLQPGGWERFKPYTSLRANPDFTRVVIVTRFDIETPERPSEELNVNYPTVGYYQVGAGYTAASSASTVQAVFRVQEQSGVLLVSGVTPTAPHVSPRAALAWMNRLLDDPKTTDLERTLLKDAVHQLNGFLPQPRPAAATSGN